MRSRANLFSHPIHPMLVAFPLALLIASFGFDLVAYFLQMPSLWTAGYYCMAGGLIMAAVAAIPGAIDYFGVVPPRSSARTRALQHAFTNIAVIGVFIAALVYRGGPAQKPNPISLILQAVGTSLLFISGWLGATLVYRNQIGVDRRYANAGKWKEIVLHTWDQPVCKVSDLSEGQIMLARIQGARVAVSRCASGVVAFADRCTHKGGPLSDGALVGCTVQCPWHGSQFDITTGRVVSGPAEERVLTYDVVVRRDDVYVYPKRSEQEKAA